MGGGPGIHRLLQASQILSPWGITACKQYLQLCARSIVVFKALLAPGFRWLVSSTVPAWAPALDGGLYLAYTLAWLFPAYIVSFIVNCLWWAPKSFTMLVMQVLSAKDSLCIHLSTYLFCLPGCMLPKLRWLRFLCSWITKAFCLLEGSREGHGKHVRVMQREHSFTKAFCWGISRKVGSACRLHVFLQVRHPEAHAAQVMRLSSILPSATKAVQVLLSAVLAIVPGTASTAGTS